MHDFYESYRKHISKAMDKTLVKTDLPYPDKKQGKVRDSYRLDKERLLFITSDRQSAFDRVLASVPFKGAVLNLTSAWWFERTRHIIPNHLLGIPDPNVTIARSCQVFPIEFVVRAYMTGSTDTSLWTHYRNGERVYCGNVLDEGMKKNERLPKTILTPTTKEAIHDRPIAPQEIISEGWMQKEDWEQASQAALELFAFGQKEAQKRGLVLVDTKYEMGKDAQGNITLIDEIHTPDSSRYWLSDTYEQRISQGLEPESIDKEFLRLWFCKVCDPYHDEILPAAPEELVSELSLRYIRLFEMITGDAFPFPTLEEAEIPVATRIERNLERFFTTEEK